MECLDKNQSNMVKTDKILIFENGTLSDQVTGEEFNEGQYILYKSHNQTKIATCKISLPTNCKYVLKGNSSWKLFSNRSIFSNVTNMWFEFGEYATVDGVAWLCLREKINSKDDQSKSEKFHTLALTYSSLFCLTISIVSLIVLPFIYSITPSLRNLPGKNLMFFAVFWHWLSSYSSCKGKHLSCTKCALFSPICCTFYSLLHFHLQLRLPCYIF